jgi:hypothetical protein
MPASALLIENKHVLVFGGDSLEPSSRQTFVNYIVSGLPPGTWLRHGESFVLRNMSEGLANSLWYCGGPSGHFETTSFLNGCPQFTRQVIDRCRRRKKTAGEENTEKRWSESSYHCGLTVELSGARAGV